MAKFGCLGQILVAACLLKKQTFKKATELMRFVRIGRKWGDLFFLGRGSSRMAKYGLRTELFLETSVARAAYSLQEEMDSLLGLMALELVGICLFLTQLNFQGSSI